LGPARRGCAAAASLASRPRRVLLFHASGVAQLRHANPHISTWKWNSVVFQPLAAAACLRCIKNMKDFIFILPSDYFVLH
jgi:hypothetical protein